MRAPAAATCSWKSSVELARGNGVSGTLFGECEIPRGPRFVISSSTAFDPDQKISRQRLPLSSGATVQQAATRYAQACLSTLVASSSHSVQIGDLTRVPLAFLIEPGEVRTGEVAIRG
jgi:hypothetical protein